MIRNGMIQPLQRKTAVRDHFPLGLPENPDTHLQLSFFFCVKSSRENII
jgi:hypothetical protein